MDQVSRKEEATGPGQEAGKDHKGKRRVRNDEDLIESAKTRGQKKP